MRDLFLEIDDIGLTVDMDDPAQVLALVLHCAPATAVQDTVLTIKLGDLTVSCMLANPSWHQVGELPRYNVTGLAIS